MSGLTEAYLGELERRLSFDRRLAKRARDDLTEYLAETRGSMSEHVALGRFGSADDVARSYAIAAFPNRMRQTMRFAVGLALTTFVFMRIRSILLALHIGDGMAFADGAAFTIGAGLCFASWRASANGQAGAASRYLGWAILALGGSTLVSLMRAVAVAGDVWLVGVTGLIQLGLLAFCTSQLSRIGQHLRQLT